jgi:hypothetical protein
MICLGRGISFQVADSEVKVWNVTPEDAVNKEAKITLKDFGLSGYLSIGALNETDVSNDHRSFKSLLKTGLFLR